MINYNKNLKVIDVSMGMNYDNNIAELWLNPYNYLMMAQNTKNGLLEYISNPYLISNDEGTGIENKYEELKYNISRYENAVKTGVLSWDDCPEDINIKHVKNHIETQK